MNNKQDYYDKCKELADKELNYLPDLSKKLNFSNKICGLGLITSPFLVGIPFALVECKRNAIIRENIAQKYRNWDIVYSNCLRKNRKKN